MDNLRELREAKGWTLEDEASKFGVSAMSIHRWETGKAKPHRVFKKKLEKLFNIKKGSA